MLVRDIDRKLNRRLVISLKQSTELFEATRKFNQTLPATVFVEDNATYLNVFFPKDNENDTQFKILLRRFDAIERKDGYVVKDRINNIKDMKIVNELLSIPSMALNRLDIYKGEMHFYSRFHDNYLPEVSEALSRYTADGENTRIEWLGPSPGIINILEQINSRYPISLLSYQVPVDPDDEILNSVISDVPHLLEIENSHTHENRFKTLLYSGKPLVDLEPHEIRTISNEDMIYETYGSNKLLSEVRKRANEIPVIRLRYFVKKVGNSMEVDLFIPTNQTHEYYSLLYQIAKDEDYKLIVKNYIPYGNEIWDFI